MLVRGHHRYLTSAPAFGKEEKTTTDSGQGKDIHELVPFLTLSLKSMPCVGLTLPLVSIANRTCKFVEQVNIFVLGGNVLQYARRNVW